MELMLIFCGVIFVGIIIFLLIERPYLLVALEIFLYLYDFNLETSLPLDPRGIMLILLFLRLVVFDRENIDLIVKYLFAERFFYFINIFFFLGLFVALFYSLKTIPQIRSFILLYIATLLGFIVTANEKGKHVFIYAIMLSASISALDIFYSFLFTNMTSSMNMTNIMDLLFFNRVSYFNPAAVGLMCAMGFIYSYLLYIRKELNKILSLSLIFVFGMAVLLSTSRSTLISIIIIFILLCILQREFTISIKAIFNTLIIGFVFFASFYLFYNTILKSDNLHKSTLDEIYWRLYIEPMNIFGGEDVKVYSKWTGEAKEGTMTWRYFRSLQDLQRYSGLPLDQKVFGLGVGGYERTNFARDYTGAILGAHNGYVLLLVERGLLGLIFFIIFSVGLSIKGLRYSKKYYISTPIAYLFFMLMIYAIGQNGELTGVPAFFMIGGIIGNLNNYSEYEEEETEISELKIVQKNLIHEKYT